MHNFYVEFSFILFELLLSFIMLFISQAKSRLKLKGNKELINALETIENRAVTRGLEPDHITTLIDVAASGIQGLVCYQFLLILHKLYF